jgi:radical SAM protein with 4Fe4S-binding SPASM domain
MPNESKAGRSLQREQLARTRIDAEFVITFNVIADDRAMYVLSRPAVYALEITPVCNNRCPGCSNIYIENRTQPPMRAHTWVELLATFVPEAVQIRLTGGEPSLHPGFFSILEAATAHDAWVTVFTNGRWPDPVRFVQRLRDWPQLSGLLVSLHGAHPESHETFTRVPGSFGETLANVRLALENGLTVALSTIITGQSWDQVGAVAELARELGVQHVAFNRYLGGPLPGLEPTLEQVQAAVDRIEALAQAGEAVKYGIGIPQCFAPNRSEGCLAGVAYASVDPWGNLRPCAHSPTVVGSLRQSSLADLWHSPAMDAWRALMPPECTTCAAYAACHGGCRAVQELRSDGRDPLRGESLAHYAPPQTVHQLPADLRPRTCVRLRSEPFGYALLGGGQVMPVRPEARPVVEACDGSATFAELTARFGQSGLDLLGAMWEKGMLELA